MLFNFITIFTFFILKVFAQNAEDSYNYTKTINSDVTVKWNVYTKYNRYRPYKSLENLDLRKPLKIFIHGFLQDADNIFTLEQKDNYFELYDCNVVIIDWSEYSQNYFTAVHNAKAIADYIADELFSYFKYNTKRYENIHILGFSLGAHIGGYIGKNIQKLAGRKIGRITGFDPAAPLVKENDSRERLDEDDAIFVDVIHTDIGRVGMASAIGAVDFYPNGGKNQPGCKDMSAAQFINRIVATASCSHNRSRVYFTTSMLDKTIIATKCQSWKMYQQGRCKSNEKIVFGEHVPKHAHGKYFFEI